MNTEKRAPMMRGLKGAIKFYQSLRMMGFSRKSSLSKAWNFMSSWPRR